MHHLNGHRTPHREPADIQEKLDRGLVSSKIIRSGNQHSSCVVVTPSQVSLSGSMTGEESVGINVVAERGVAIQGSLGIAAMPQGISVAGLWCLNPLALSCMASTVASPIPMYTFNVPLGNIRSMISGFRSVMTLAQRHA